MFIDFVFVFVMLPHLCTYAIAMPSKYVSTVTILSDWADWKIESYTMMCAFHRCAPIFYWSSICRFSKKWLGQLIRSREDTLSLHTI